MGKQSQEPCPACQDQGWVFCNAGNDETPAFAIQRCDACEKLENDLAARAAAEKAIQNYAALFQFVDRVSRLKQENEPDEEDPFERTSEDSIAALNEIILEARQLMGTAEQCTGCGEIVPYIIGCPNGAELCPDCFEAGHG